MIIDTTSLESIIAAIVMILSALYAWYQKRNATEIKEAFVSGTPQSASPQIVAKLPERSWKMSESTKRYCTFDASPENRATILKQIDEAEAEMRTHYTIGFEGGYYIIDYGLLMGGAGNPSGMKTN